MDTAPPKLPSIDPILSGNPRLVSLHERIAQQAIDSSKLPGALAAKEKCEEELARLHATIRGLLEQVTQGVQDLPESLAQLRSLNDQSRGLVAELQALRQSQPSQTDTQELSRKLGEITAQIAGLQGEIKGGFKSLEAIISAGNTGIIEGMRAQQSQSSDTKETILQQQVQLTQQTKLLGELKGEFSSLQRESQENFEESQRVKVLLETCNREKDEANRQLLLSKGLAERLQQEFAKLESQKATLDESLASGQREIDRLASEVSLKTALATQSQETARAAQQGVQEALGQLAEERRKGNSEQLVALNAALRQEQERAQRSEQEKIRLLHDKEEAERAKRRAEADREDALEKSAFAQGAAETASQTLQQLEQSRALADDVIARRNAEAEEIKSQELRALTANFERDCNERVRLAEQRVMNDFLLRIQQAEQRVRQEYEPIISDLNGQIENLHYRIQEELNRQADYVRQIKYFENELETRDQEVTNLQTIFQEEIDDCEDLRKIVQWNRQPIVNIINPPLIEGQQILQIGTTISFTVLNRADLPGSTVAFFNYPDKTDYVDITNDDIKEYVIKNGLIHYGAFNF